MPLILAAATIFVGIYSLASGRVLTRLGTLALAGFGVVVLLSGLNAMHWHMSWTDMAAFLVTVSGLIAALQAHRRRTFVRNRAFA